MCDPVSLTIAATAVAAGGKIMSGVASAKQAGYAASISHQNAVLAEGQARDSIENTKLEAARRYREGAQLSGQQTASMAANGVDLSFGSAAQTAGDTAMITGEDVGQIYKAGNERTKGYEINAFNYNADAAAKKAQKKAAIIGTVFDVAGTVLGGASQTGKMKAGF